MATKKKAAVKKEAPKKAAKKKAAVKNRNRSHEDLLQDDYDAAANAVQMGTMKSSDGESIDCAPDESPTE